MQLGTQRMNATSNTPWCVQPSSPTRPARFAKPIDGMLLQKLAESHDLLVTVEECVLAGSFGSAVGEVLLDRGIHFEKGLQDRERLCGILRRGEQ